MVVMTDDIQAQDLLVPVEAQDLQVQGVMVQLILVVAEAVLVIQDLQLEAGVQELFIYQYPQLTIVLLQQVHLR